MGALTIAIRRDLPLHAVILAYAALCGLVAEALGSAHKFLPFLYITRWIVLLATIAIVYMLAQTVRASRSPDPLQQIRTLLAAKAVGFGAGAVLCSSLALLHGTYTSMKTIVPDVRAFRYDLLLADIDKTIHGADPWTYLQWLNPFTQLIQPLYSLGWLFMVVMVTTLAAVSSPSRQLRAQYGWTFVLCWMLLGNLLSSRVLAAGPVYYSKVVGSDRFDVLVEHLARNDGPLSAYRIQEHLWTAYATETSSFATGISAFPSMHVSMVTLFTLYGMRISSRLGIGFGIYALLILLASVHLGWHYAVDGYFSIVATLLIWKVVGWALVDFPRRAPRRQEVAAAEAC